MNEEDTQLPIHLKSFAIFIVLMTISLNIMAQQKIVQTAGRTQLGEFAPEFAHLNDDILSEKYGAAMTCFHCATAVW